METALDVDANALIGNVAEKLKGMKLEKPKLIDIVKSGAHAERPPEDENFWYIRCASILRQTYARNEVGVNRLRRHYGGRKSRGVKPEKHYPAGGGVIRKALQQLEKAGLLKREKTGRILTAEGRKLLDRAAKEVSNERGGA